MLEILLAKTQRGVLGSEDCKLSAEGRRGREESRETEQAAPPKETVH